MAEREKQLEKVEKSFKLNPLEVLMLPTHATVSEVKAQYRKISLSIHPDKMKPEVKDRAQKAFAKLADAKVALLDEVKRRALTEMVVRARTQLLQTLQKKEKESRKAKVRAKEAHVAIMMEPMPDFASQDGFDDAVKATMKELLIDDAWRQRQLMKAAHREEKVIAKARKEVVAKIDQQEKEKEVWEEKREVRVTSWRDFQKKKKKKNKKKRKIATGWAEDSDRTFVRRPKKLM